MTFTANANGDVYAMLVQSDGKIVVGGSFTQLDGQLHRNLGRLNADGHVDASFAPTAGGPVRCLAPQADGKIIVVGDFVGFNGLPLQRIARMSADGMVDNTFTPTANSTTVWTAAVQVDGKVLVGGIFTNLSGVTRNRLGRFNRDGSLDSSFNPGVDQGGQPPVNALAVQPDGKILVGGFFTNLAGQFRNNLGRLNSDGSLDSSFDSSNTLAGGAVTSIIVQSDGDILVANGSNAHHVNPANGQVNTLVAPPPDNLLRSLALQRDGKALFGGNFTTVGGESHSRIARLLSGNLAEENLDMSADGSTVTWMRTGSGPEVQQVTFERSFDGADFTSLGFGTHIPSGWQLSGLSLPTGQFMYLRARGRAIGGLFNGSSSLIESAKNFPGIAGPLLAAPTSLGNGAFQFNFFHSRGVTFSVFAATNPTLSFSNWTNIGTPTPLGNNVFQFTDLDATNYPHRFYQLRTPSQN